MDWQGQNVLITGCSGLLGSWLTHDLLRRGAHVVGLFRHNPENSLLKQLHLLEKIDVVRGDICQPDLIAQTVKEHHIHFIFHLAAQTQVGIAYQDPLATFETNIRGTWLLLEAARQHKDVAGILVVSSDKAYGQQPSLPYQEDAPLLGQHPYDVSKSCADLIARTYAHTYDLPVAVARCANLYGGGDLNWNRLIPGTIRSVLKQEAPVIRSDGKAKRNYIFVQDVVQGFVTILENIGRSDVRGEAFNVGADHAYTVLEVIQTIIQLSDLPTLKPIIQNRVQGNEIQEQNLSSAKAKRLLNWQPTYSLEEGLRHTLGWYVQFLQGSLQ